MHFETVFSREIEVLPGDRYNGRARRVDLARIWSCESFSQDFYKFRSFTVSRDETNEGNGPTPITVNVYVINNKYDNNLLGSYTAPARSGKE